MQHRMDFGGTAPMMDRGGYMGERNEDSSLSACVAAALAALEEAASPTERAARRVASALEHPRLGPREAEQLLTRVKAFLSAPASPQLHSVLASSGLPTGVVQVLRKFREDPPVAALACGALRAAAAHTEGPPFLARAGAIGELCELMDRHPGHGGVQNIALLPLLELSRDAMVARQAVTCGCVPRVLRAMEATAGREVQFNGCVVLRLLADQGRAPRTGLQEAALRAKVAHQADSALCVAANDVLALVTPRFKAVLCWHWQSGRCRLGPRCTYAHGPSELLASTRM